MAKSDGGDYFKRTSNFWIAAVTFGVSLYSCMVFTPEIIPCQYLGLFGSFLRYLVDNHSGIMYKGWWLALGIHVIESLVSLNVCSNKGINSTSTRLLWFFQTFLFGFASLGLLLKYDPERPKQH
ncbi:transmembrane protein 254 [Aulostomus maculatus]